MSWLKLNYNKQIIILIKYENKKIKDDNDNANAKNSIMHEWSPYREWTIVWWDRYGQTCQYNDWYNQQLTSMVSIKRRRSVFFDQYVDCSR